MSTTRAGADERRRWLEAQQLFEQALERPATERAAYVRSAARQDRWLAQSVLDLLALDDDSSPLDHPFPFVPVDPAAEREMRVGEQLDKYHLLERIGVGGMGSVYRAEHRDGNLRQEVALKVLHTSLSEEARHRFVQEQRILADLHHPNIARLQDFGSTAAGITYLVMNLVAGTAITDHADERRLSLVARIRQFLQVCDAVRHAHQRLIVHRDLKPANILVTADGQVQLLDFGIAKILDPAEHLGGTATRTELRVMTPSYASPEQLLGQTITTGTDIWALGVLLFELLTGQRPFHWAGMSLIDIARHLEHAPSRLASASFASTNGDSRERARRRGLDPRRLHRRLRGDLDLIISRALTHRPGERYASVEALAQDLERYLAGRPILARRPSLAYQAARFFRRYTLRLAGLTTILLFLFSFSALQAREPAGSSRRTEAGPLDAAFNGADPSPALRIDQ